MNRKLAFVFSVLAAAEMGTAMAAPKAGKSAKAAAAASDPAALPLLVDVAWLAAHVDDPKLVLLHVGEGGAYAKQHVRGARLVTMFDIAVTAQMGKGLVLELPPAEELKRRLEALGISDDSRVVVIFGDDWVSPATRVILTLDAAGLGAHTALLDGGMAAWLRAGHAVTDAIPPVKAGVLAPLKIKPIIADATAVLASLGKPGVAVVDARDREFYDGSKPGGMGDHVHRAGHIKGALSLPYGSVVDAKNLLRSDDELRALFRKAGVKPGDQVIAYCHIGQQATAIVLAARKLGYAVQLYDGAFEDWSLFHPGYPVETSPASAPAPKAKP